MSDTDRANAKLANMAWVGAVLIALIHINNFAVCETPAAAWLKFVCEQFLCPMAVPFFFLSSGWFLARHVEEAGWWRRELKKRVRSVLVPFAIVSLLTVCAEIVLAALAAMTSGKPLAGLFTLGGLLSDLGLNPCAFPGHKVLWFLRTLMVLVVLSPVLVRGVRACGVGLPLVFAAGSIGIRPFVYGVEETPLSLLLRTTLNDSGFTYFTLGLFLRLKGLRPVVSPRVAWALLFVSSVVPVALHWCGCGIPSSLCSASLDVMVFCRLLGFIGVMPSVRLPWVWTSFAVFLFHTFATSALHLSGALPERLDAGYYLATTAIAVFLPMGSAWMLVTYLPNLARIIFGGRVK